MNLPLTEPTDSRNTTLYKVINHIIDSRDTPLERVTNSVVIALMNIRDTVLGTAVYERVSRSFQNESITK